MAGFALLGSCVTRDALLPSIEAGASITVVSRTGFASLMAPRVEGLILPEPLGRLKPGGYAERCVRAEMEKTGLDTLEAQAPDILLVDLMDDRLPLFAAGGSVFCYGTEFEQSGLEHHPALAGGRVIDRLSSEAWRLWHEGLLRFAERRRTGPLAQAHLVLHRSYMTTRIEPGEGEDVLRALFTSSETRLWIMRINAVLARMHLAFLAAMPDAMPIDVPREHLRADAAHMWGPGPCHFVRDYYEAFLGEARRLGVDLG